MAAHKRTPFQRKKDKEIIAGLYLERKTQMEIAEILNARCIPKEQPITEGKTHYKLSQKQISYDLKEIEREWLKSSLMNINEAKARELARIDAVERQAWKGWMRSVGKNKKVTAKIRNVPGIGQVSEGITTEQEMAGDPSFLVIIVSCIKQRAELLGIEAPKKFEHTGSINIDKFDPRRMTDDQLERLQRGEDPLLVVPDLRKQ